MFTVKFKAMAGTELIQEKLKFQKIIGKYEVYPDEISPRELWPFEQQIVLLKEENTHLKMIIEKLLAK